MSVVERYPRRPLRRLSLYYYLPDAARENEDASEKCRVRKKMTNARDAKLRPADPESERWIMDAK